MTAYTLLVSLITALAGSAVDKPAPPLPNPAKLTPEDKKLLDQLIEEGLFDPKGAVRVSVNVLARSVWAQQEEVSREGWLVPGSRGTAARVYFTDGEWIAAPAEKQMKKLDFIAACRGRYEENKPDKNVRMSDGGSPYAWGFLVEADLTRAGWLYKLGDERLAVMALARARQDKGGDPRATLRAGLAWSAFGRMVHAYMVRADEEALTHGERLLRLYSDIADKEYQQAKTIVGDLIRRKKKGTFGSPPANWPDDFKKWDSGRKIKYLIDSLDEIDVPQQGQPGGVDLASDRGVMELIVLGEAAVPALIDTVEADKRLTRSVHFFRDFARHRTVLGVREAALTAVMSILRVRIFETGITGDSFTQRGEEGVEQVAKRLHAYWNKYGKLPFAERMMKVLTDPKSSSESGQEAADNLAHLGQERTLGTTVWTDRIGSQSGKPTAALAKFKEPTVGEAILIALDRDLQAHAAKPNDMLHDFERRQIENNYFNSLAALNGRGATQELAKSLARTANARMRCLWAVAARRLGADEPLQSFADDFRAGKIVLRAQAPANAPDGEQAVTAELAALIDRLAFAGTSETDRALMALAEPKHPYHALTKQRLLSKQESWDKGPWFLHPYCLAVLRRALDDITPTGVHYLVDKKWLSFREHDKTSSGKLPEFLADPNVRRTEADERVCDHAAQRLGELVIGIPFYHPLYKDADKRLVDLKATFDRYAARYQRAHWYVHDLMGPGSASAPISAHRRPVYIPVIRPLGRGATAADVAAGNALFHLDGKGKPLALKLPAGAVLWNDARKNPAGIVRVLIMQAEEGPDRKVAYGAIGHNFFRTLSAKDVTDFFPVDRLIWSEE